MSDQPTQHKSPHGVGHVVPPKILFATGGALLVLTVITVLAAKIDFEDMGVPELNIFVALAIAVVKASLVVLFFMHLRWDRPFNSIVLVTSVAFVALFIAFAMTDTFAYREDVRGFAQERLVSGNAEHVKTELDATAQKLGESQQHGDTPAAAGADAHGP
jgi:cytochrome c oxidase subunit 4